MEHLDGDRIIRKLTRNLVERIEFGAHTFMLLRKPWMVREL